MTIGLLWWGAALGLVLALRAWLVHRAWDAPPAVRLDAVAYDVGSAVIIERNGPAQWATVICMPGFLEDPRYFLHTYADPDLQLILLSSADYHVPFAGLKRQPAPWARTPTVEPGTIEYDAMVLVQALEHLPRTTSIRVHGHSRGGAVALEAASLRPDLFRDVELVLEAPVLPQSPPSLRLSPLVRWMFPFLMRSWRRHPISKANRHLYGRLDDPRKRELIEAFPFNPRRVLTLGRNVASLARWVRERDFRLYANVRRGVILIPDDDRILNPASMRSSAQHAQPHLSLVAVQDCSHFIAFDQPQAIPALRPPRLTGVGVERRPG
jgi:pimeloyl-ACP methyl ester carboxylesterase